MHNAIKLTDITIAHFGKAANGGMEYSGTARYRVQSESIAFEFVHRFNNVAEISNAIQRGSMLLKQELEHLAAAAANIPAILSNQ